jgi:Uma2 family endonuclease
MIYVLSGSHVLDEVPMNALHDLRMSKAAFLRWVEGREGRYELVGGRVVAQDTGTRGHSRIGMAFYDMLRARLSVDDWTVHVGQLSVAIGDEVRVADAMVEPGGLPMDEIASEAAVLLVEVTSPSSKGHDHGDKRQLYQSLPSLEAYIIASSDEPRLWIWQRATDGARDFPERPRKVLDRDEVITLAHFDVAFTLDEIYKRIMPRATGSINEP